MSDRSRCVSFYLRRGTAHGGGQTEFGSRPPPVAATFRRRPCFRRRMPASGLGLMGARGPIGPRKANGVIRSAGLRSIRPSVSVIHICIIWNIMGICFVISLAIIRTKLVRSLTIAVRTLSNILRNTIPKWSNIDHKWANTPPGGAWRRRGVYLAIKGLYLSTSGLYFVEI